MKDAEIRQPICLEPIAQEKPQQRMSGDTRAPAYSSQDSGSAAKRSPAPATDSGAAHEDMRKSDPMIVFAYDCLRREFQSLRSQQPSPGALPDAASIHQMRTRARRLRVALRLFKEMLPEQSAKRLRRELRWFARALGEVRDLDVHAEHLRAYVHGMAESADLAGTGAQVHELAPYELSLRRARNRARSDLGPLFASERYAALLQSFDELLTDAPSRGALRRWRSFRIKDAAPLYVGAAAKRMLKRGRKVDGQSPPKRLHRLRIGTKRLRYELEFFDPLYPALGKPAKAAKRLQDLLGDFQDACTAAQRLRAYARETRANGNIESVDRSKETTGLQTHALRHLLDAQQQKAEAVRTALASEWRRFEKALTRHKIAKRLES